jgi:hypothetical protein
MDNSQMHATNVIRIVVQKTDDNFVIRGLHCNLFEYLAPSGVAVEADRVEKE